LVEIAGHMSIANTVLEEALKNINPEKIEELMDKLQENAEMVQEVNGLLSAGIGGIDFDEEKALLELEERKTVPLLKKEEEEEEKETKKQNKILDLEI
jgi:ribosomal protein L16 Arg81 hydroxylase